MKFMSSFLRKLLSIFVCALLFLSPNADAQTCRSQTFVNRAVPYDSCADLPHLNSFLHWTYFPDNKSLSIAYRAPMESDGWRAWAINPTGGGMVGAQALMGVRLANGTTFAYATQVTDYHPALTPGNLTLPVSDLTFDVSDGAMTLSADIGLPDGQTTINHVWQEGPISTDGMFAPHRFDSAHLSSSATLNLLSSTHDHNSSSPTSSQGSSSPAIPPKLRRKYVHGILCALSWGMLMPIGALIARYLKTFKEAGPAWFYLHVSCQITAYLVGVAGWGMGLKLGSDSANLVYHAHRNIGITLFALGTLQALAMFLRPKPDHKYRVYWNIYHHSCGYSTIILSIINVFKGLEILDPDRRWRRAYISFVTALGAVALVLEIVTWAMVLRRRRQESSKAAKDTTGVNCV